MFAFYQIELLFLNVSMVYEEVLQDKDSLPLLVGLHQRTQKTSLLSRYTLADTQRLREMILNVNIKLCWTAGPHRKQKIIAGRGWSETFCLHSLSKARTSAGVTPRPK